MLDELFNTLMAETEVVAASMTATADILAAYHAKWMKLEDLESDLSAEQKDRLEEVMKRIHEAGARW